MARSNPSERRSRRRPGPRSSPDLSPSASQRRQRRGASTRGVKRSRPPLNTPNSPVSHSAHPPDALSTQGVFRRTSHRGTPQRAVSGQSLQSQVSPIAQPPLSQQPLRSESLPRPSQDGQLPYERGRREPLQFFPSQQKPNHHDHYSTQNQHNLNQADYSSKDWLNPPQPSSPSLDRFSAHPSDSLRSQSSSDGRWHRSGPRERNSRPLRSNIRKTRPQKKRNERPLPSIQPSAPSLTPHRSDFPRADLQQPVSYPVAVADRQQKLAFNARLSHPDLSPLQRQQSSSLTHPSPSRYPLPNSSSTALSATHNVQPIPTPIQGGQPQVLHPRPVMPRTIKYSEPKPSVRTSRQPLSPPKRRTAKPATSPLIYAIRLLILGTGLGVVAGTIISVLEPSKWPVSRAAGDRNENATETIDTDGRTDPSAGIDPANASGTSSLSASHDGQSNVDNTLPKRQAYTELASQLDALGQAQPGLFPGVFAIDLDTYNYVGVNESMTFSAASTIKVPVLIAFFQDVEQSKIRLDEVMTMTAEDVAGGSGDMQLGAVGDTYTAIETATKMIVISDNTATNMLIRRMGGAEKLNQRFQSWGLNLTQIRNPLPDLDGTNTTSPAELTQLMALVSEGKLLSMRSRDRMLDIMYRTQTATLLPAGIGGNAAIAHKTGDIGLMVGDTGLVDSPNGKRYAITILMRRPHNDNRAQELIRQMAGLIHEEIQVPPTPLREVQGVDLSSDGPPTTSGTASGTTTGTTDGDTTGTTTTE